MPRTWLQMYRGWLLECIFVRGWTTLKCANEIGANPQDVLDDFNEFVWEDHK